MVPNSPSISLIIEFQYIRRVGSALSACTPVVIMNSSASPVQFLLSLVLQTPLISKVTQVSTLSPLPFSETVLYNCNTSGFFCHILYWDLQSSKWLFKNVHTLSIFFVLLSSMGFDKHLNSCVHFCSLQQSSFTALNNPLCFTYSILHPCPLLSPWQSLMWSLSSFTFSWSHIIRIV